MLHLHPRTAYYWYQGAADMRKSFDGLCGIVRQQMNLDVVSGAVFIFMNRKRNQVKLLTWEGDGLSIYYKRLEKGVYEAPVLQDGIHPCIQMDMLQLQLILQGVETGSIRKKKRFAWPVHTNS